MAGVGAGNQQGLESDQFLCVCWWEAKNELSRGWLNPGAPHVVFLHVCLGADERRTEILLGAGHFGMGIGSTPHCQFELTPCEGGFITSASVQYSQYFGVRIQHANEGRLARLVDQQLSQAVALSCRVQVRQDGPSVRQQPI